MKVLVVDDSAVVRTRLVEILSALQGVEHVDTAGRASEARQAIQSARPDVVVLDIHMPGGSGIEVLEALRAEDQRIMTIVLTNDPAPQWRAASLRAGADFFFDKSAEFQQAVDVIARLALGHAALGDPLPRCWTCFEGLPIPAWISDVDTLEFKTVNDAAVGRYGYSREEFLAMTLVDIRPPETVPMLMEHIASRRSGETIRWIGMRQHRAKDGSPIYVEISLIPFDGAGRRLDVVLAHDISERIFAEDLLRASENRYRDLFENATDAIFTTDVDLNVTSLNNVGEALIGYTQEEASHVNVATLVTPDALETIQHELANQLAGKPASLFEAAILARDGRTVPIEVKARLVYHDGKLVGSQGVARDISERKRLELGLRQAQKMEAIGLLAGGVAHDFNNLLTVILGYCELLLAGFDPADPRQADMAEIQKAGARAAGLTRQLLAFSRKQIIQPTLLDLNVVAADMRAMLGRLIREDVKVVLELRPELALVKADRGQVEQIVMNLAVNARDAMPRGGTLTIETANVKLDETEKTHVSVKSGPYVTLTVTDTGTGMAPQVQARLFEPFFTTKELGHGTGLGLATVRAIVAQSGGSVTVDSEVGRGTSVTVYFPRADATEMVADVAPPAPGPTDGAETVLVVEDAEGLGELAKRLLERQGYAVLFAANADEALQLFERNASIDVLLTDVVMPGASGPELTRRLVGRRPGLKVLYMSGYTAEAIAQHGMLSPGIMFLQKPFTSETLGRKIREVLDR
jgi:two-component system, cell cycle sensor histidine kinase and response regulator CckA